MQPPNMRLQLAGALVLMEAVGSCPGGHGTSSTTGCAGALIARDPLGGCRAGCSAIQKMAAGTDT